jgi:hypothetical protein
MAAGGNDSSQNGNSRWQRQEVTATATEAATASGNGKQQAVEIGNILIWGGRCSSLVVFRAL